MWLLSAKLVAMNLCGVADFIFSITLISFHSLSFQSPSLSDFLSLSPSLRLLFYLPTFYVLSCCSLSPQSVPVSLPAPPSVGSSCVSVCVCVCVRLCVFVCFVLVFERVCLLVCQGYNFIPEFSFFFTHFYLFFRPSTRARHTARYPLHPDPCKLWALAANLWNIMVKRSYKSLVDLADVCSLNRHGLDASSH